MRFFLVVLASISITACASTTNIEINQPAPQAPKATGVVEAGAVTVDITPAPGMPMGGYSVMANKGEGFRTRLKARVVYLNDGQGKSMALVQTDLTSGSLLVHHLVSERVAQQTGLKPADITITSSHSHSAPVNFFDNDFYNKHMSSGKWLEEQFLELVVDQISNAILDAHENRRPAKIATGVKEIPGIARNRAMAAYVRNENVTGIDLDDPEAKFKAINPNLYMVRVDVKDDDGAFKPLAAFSGFSLHNTTLSVPVEVYNADVFAYAAKDLEWDIQKRYNTSWDIVHALSNATHGDLAPATEDKGDHWIRHFPVDWKAAKELGQRLGAGAIELFDELEPQLTTKVTLDSAARELNIRENNKIGDVEICKDPAVGNTVAAGAYERRTPWLTAIPFLHGGNIMARRWIFDGGCQGAKRHLGFAYLQPLLEPKDSFPNTVMFQLLRINDMIVMPLPFEVTVESGRRIAASVENEFTKAGEAINHAWVASVSNGYFGYTTTPEEYSYQNYEGGHTLYGKNSTPYIAAQLGALASDYLEQGSVIEYTPEWKYEVKTNQFLPEAQEATGTREVVKAPAAVLAKKSYEEDYVSLRWLDVNSSKINLHEPLVRVETKKNGQWELLMLGNEPINDEGYDIEVRLVKNAKDGMATYEVRWYNPVAGGEYRFVIEPRANQAELHSPVFTWQTEQGAVALVD